MSRGFNRDAKPQGPMSAYAYFVRTEREALKNKHPNEPVIFAEFQRKCEERWKIIVDEEKKPFIEMAEKDKQRCDLEMEIWRRSHIDGAKSNTGV